MEVMIALHFHIITIPVVPSISVHSSGWPVVGENYSLICSIARTDPFNFTSITYQWFNENSESWAQVENQTIPTFNPRSATTPCWRVHMCGHSYTLNWQSQSEYIAGCQSAK